MDSLDIEEKTGHFIMKTVNGTFHFIAIPSFRTIRFGGKGRLATSGRERTMEKIFFGAVKPEGALRASMERDMNGCIGHFEVSAHDCARPKKSMGLTGRPGFPNRRSWAQAG